jgi:hypothetical protein
MTINVRSGGDGMKGIMLCKHAFVLMSSTNTATHNVSIEAISDGCELKGGLFTYRDSMHFQTKYEFLDLSDNAGSH